MEKKAAYLAIVDAALTGPRRIHTADAVNILGVSRYRLCLNSLPNEVYTFTAIRYGIEIWVVVKQHNF